MHRTGEVQRLSDAFQKSDEPLFKRMRELLLQRGIAPGDAVLAILFRDDVDLYFGILVAPGGRVYEFDFDYSGRGIGEGAFSRWADVSSTYADGGFADYVDAAVEWSATSH